MSAAPSSLDDSNQVLLCWSDPPDSPSREQVVQLIEADTSEALIRSTLKVQEKTKVRLIGEKYTGNGIVRSCKKVQSGFMLTIWIAGAANSSCASERDPGVLAVEDFLTEEQEAEILGEVEHELRLSLCRVSG